MKIKNIDMCCSINKSDNLQENKKHYIIGKKKIGNRCNEIPVVSTELKFIDHWNNLKVRLNINRMHYSISPGVYAVGNPEKNSIVLVSANYKLSFDLLRRELKGKDAWILVLDTKGINVWCAAGKGTFGTDELVKRIELSGLKDLVQHRFLIVPQLGAVGVAAHEVKKRSEFTVKYGPIRVSDLNDFLKSGMKIRPEMRRVDFNLIERLKVTPVEIVQGFRYFVVLAVVFFFLSGFIKNGYVFNIEKGITDVFIIFVAFIAGTLLGPILLPFLPGKSFSLKGAFVGIIAFLLLYVFLFEISKLEILSWLLLIPAISSFLLMNFTGASTYTSLSGVKKEMRIAIPIQIVVAILGLTLWLSSCFI